MRACLCIAMHRNVQKDVVCTRPSRWSAEEGKKAETAESADRAVRAVGAGCGCCGSSPTNLEGGAAQSPIEPSLAVPCRPCRSGAVSGPNETEILSPVDLPGPRSA